MFVNFIMYHIRRYAVKPFLVNYQITEISILWLLRMLWTYPSFFKCTVLPQPSIPSLIIELCVDFINHNVLLFQCELGVDGHDGQTVTIVTNQAGVSVDGQEDTFDYPILTNLTLMCVATAADGLPATSYHWNTVNCYGGGGSYSCFYSQVQTVQNITGYNLQALDAGTVNCTATINGTNYTSNPLTLRISGELTIMKIFLAIYLIENGLTFYLITLMLE